MARGEPGLSADQITLLDGGIGVELRARLPDADTGLLPVTALIERPDVVRDVHRAYLAAGATVLTTNTYATVAARMGAFAPRWAELLRLGARLAGEARGATKARIAGSLPPLHGSYRPDGVGEFSAIREVYAAHVAELAPLVDLFLCETMSTALEARA
ncbi:MAG: homocysteine S-methyltransferase family protein, partial [Pseudomonadota bacterium]